ncbi:transcription termination/antitermination NusG family protein [Mesorhizobium sp. M4B.F.Ca.ET.017.02.2.1]|uniref:transcription termination/antitermination protein NusG n=1 Tax=Mesorhizobium sp. M4B.F.Ca.ET.017.02.2.1 TaxID=2496649 RepID=UPI000FCA550F|nr:transcription termination/antitermination NusG family protein [Mesorhizobium sp. M4B.F.Ca.ET.017.02.2.1]RVD31435.1 hypothetical protein EN738_01910 [Mesorhizobium sp. M4B.F.Ca.ET.017.02.2.1]
MNMQVAAAKMSNAFDSSPWVVVRSKPQMERVAEEEMTKRGMTAYCPTYRYEFKHHRNKKWIIREWPLLRGYLFLRADTIDWYKLTRCKAVQAILRSVGGEPIGLAPSVIEEIRARQVAGDFDMLRVHGAVVKAGLPVKVLEGPLAGLESVVETVRNGKAASILVSIFGRQVETTVPLENLGRKG